jgi:hypothetical protein
MRDFARRWAFDLFMGAYIVFVFSVFGWVFGIDTRTSLFVGFVIAWVDERRRAAHTEGENG